MTVNRRFLLKGMALGGISGLTLSSLPALAGSATTPSTAHIAATVLTLVNDTTAESAFLQAALQANGSRLHVQKVGAELGFMLNFERLLRAGQPQRVIGLLDDAAATLVIDMARSAGARVLWLGQHSTVADVTYHRLLTADNDENYARQLGQSSAQWMGHLGHHLASPHANRAAMTPFTPVASAPLSGSFVSFSIVT